jgi:hypothetical protein
VADPDPTKADAGGDTLVLEVTADQLKALCGRVEWNSTSRARCSNDVIDASSALTDRHVIMPKLFRRLAEFLEGGGSVAGFKQFLEAKQESITILPTADFTHFDTVVEVAGNIIRMTEPARESCVRAVTVPR